jgi:uncharacterized protein (DUF488 family)
MATVHTIGHSNHPLEKFLGLLKRHGITCLVDVRSRPFSRFNPHFNTKRLADALKAEGITYRWAGEHLGGMPAAAREKAGGKPDWTRVTYAPGFEPALDALVAEPVRPVAIMCAEENPNHCHRRMLLTPPLVTRGVEVLHIRGDGRIEPEAELASPQRELFR